MVFVYLLGHFVQLIFNYPIFQVLLSFNSQNFYRMNLGSRHALTVAQQWQLFSICSRAYTMCVLAYPTATLTLTSFPLSSIPLLHTFVNLSYLKPQTGGEKHAEGGLLLPVT